jgi:hypothetical protein
MLVLIATAPAVQACSSDTMITEPSSVTGAPAFAPAPTSLRVTGTVTDDNGAPVADAKVTVYRWTASGDPRSVVTDGNGFFSISVAAAEGISAIAEKAGYEAKWQSRSISREADCRFDLRMHRLEP